MLRIRTIPLAVCLSMSLVALGGDAAMAACANTFRVTDDGSRPGWYWGVSAIAPNDAWAVGGVYRNGREVERLSHWDGAAWQASTPPAFQGEVELHAVSATSSTDVWAIGTGHPFTRNEVFVAYHWDGSAWTSVPTTTGKRRMFDVVAISPTDVWAVGFSVRSGGYYARTMHWDGVGWDTVANPYSTTPWTSIYSIDAVSANDVWAVGDTRTGVMTMHWNGRRWRAFEPGGTLTAYPGLFAVTAVGPSDVWAVGHDGSGASTLLEHWNGASWKKVTPAAAAGLSTAYGVSASSATDVWVGADGATQGALLHWNGSRWRVQQAPVGTHGATWVRGMDSMVDGGTFAVGQSDDDRTYVVDRCIAV